MRAAEAAKNTARLIEGTVKKVKDGSELVARTNDAFKQVSGSSAKAADLVAEISAASNEQSQGIGQINTAVTELDKDPSLGGACIDHDACDVAVPESGAGLFLGDILCHYGEITLVARVEQTL